VSIAQKRATAERRLERLARLVSEEQRERVLAPLFRRMLELAREGGSIVAEVEHRYLTLDDMRLEVTRIADELGVEDPLSGVPLPSEAMAGRVADSDARASQIAIDEYSKQSALNRSK
jgi:hypothetical protein